MELCFVHQGLEHFSHLAPHIIAIQVHSRNLLLQVSPYYDIYVIGDYPLFLIRRSHEMTCTITPGDCFMSSHIHAKQRWMDH